MDTIRLGIIGMGLMGTKYANMIIEGKIPGAELTAICNINADKLLPFKENPKYKNVQSYTAIKAMLSDKVIDACIIATPHYYHPDIAMEAFCHGIHVLTDKPSGVYTKQVKELNRLTAELSANRSPLVFAIMYNRRTYDLYRQARRIAQEELGAIRRINWIVTDWYRSQSYYDRKPWLATWRGEGGGVVLNQALHNLDLLQWICGMPEKVTAFCHTGKWHNIETEDEASAYMEYKNGATAVFITSTGDAPGTNRLEISGQNGKLVLEDERLDFWRLTVSEEEFNKTNTEIFESPPFEKLSIEYDKTRPDHAGVISAFVQKILGKGELYADGQEGLNAVSLANAIYLSSWLGKTIELPFNDTLDELYLKELRKRMRGRRGA